MIDYAWQLYRWSSESYSGIVSISTEVGSLHIALKVTEELLTEETLSAELQTKIVGVKDDCYKTLRELQSFLARYVNQSTQSQRAWDMMDWVREEVLGLRDGLVSSTAKITVFNSTVRRLTSSRIPSTLLKFK